MVFPGTCMARFACRAMHPPELLLEEELQVGGRVSGKEGVCRMGSYCEVFQRVEKKYRIGAGQREGLQRKMAPRMAPDDFGCTRVVSLYLDTPRCELIGRSLEKPLYKEKIRLRIYGLAPEEGLAPEREVFFEIKKKFDGVVYKRRVRMSAAAAGAFFQGMPYGQACECFPLPGSASQAKSLDVRSRQIAREIEAMLQRYGQLRPTMLVSCERVAWRPDAQACSAAPSCPDASFSSDLRITFDGSLEARDVRGVAFDELFGAQAHGRWFPLISADESIMEVKAAGSFPLWLAHGLSECGAFPASFSKYGTAYSLAGV